MKKRIQERDPEWLTRTRYYTTLGGTGSASVYLALKIPLIGENFSAVALSYMNQTLTIIFLFCLFWSHREITAWGQKQLKIYREFQRYIETKKEDENNSV